MCNQIILRLHLLHNVRIFDIDKNSYDYLIITVGQSTCKIRTRLRNSHMIQSFEILEIYQ